MRKHDKMRIAMKYWLLGKGYTDAVKAMELGANHHTGFRKDGTTPEFHHQICIGSYIRTLPSLISPEDTITTTMLHDVVEDYDVSLDAIEARFGKGVRKAVSLLSKKIGGYETKSEAYYMAMKDNAIASIVKGADRMHNFQTMPGVFTPEKQRKYIQECREYILPMIRAAKRKFPEQEPAYENIKHVLLSQIGLLDIGLEQQENGDEE